MWHLKIAFFPFLFFFSPSTGDRARAFALSYISSKFFLKLLFWHKIWPNDSLSLYIAHAEAPTWNPPASTSQSFERLYLSKLPTLSYLAWIWCFYCRKSAIPRESFLPPYSLLKMRSLFSLNSGSSTLQSPPPISSHDYLAIPQDDKWSNIQ